jgi:hypothetical protein
MRVEIEKLIDSVWSTSLERMIKKDVAPIRPCLGDFIDLYVPQTRALLLMESDPTVIRSVYDTAYAAANRNTFSIMKKLGMPADYFWKFEYWPRERAYETLKKVITKVFTTMMSRSKEGGLELVSVEIEPVRFTILFKECAECAGVSVSAPICYYHAATFAGILASLLNKEMDAYETKCQGKGDESCVVVIGKRDDEEIKHKLTEYLSPIQIGTKFEDRVENCLRGYQLRSMGNLVDIGYHNLMSLSTVYPDVDVASKISLNLGNQYGVKLAPVLARYYQDNSLEIIKKYFNQLHHLEVKSIIRSGNDVEVTLDECAEVMMQLKKLEILSFLFGELQGLVIGLLNQAVVYKENLIEDCCVKIRFTLPS